MKSEKRQYFYLTQRFSTKCSIYIQIARLSRPFESIRIQYNTVVMICRFARRPVGVIILHATKERFISCQRLKIKSVLSKYVGDINSVLALLVMVEMLHIYLICNQILTTSFHAWSCEYGESGWAWKDMEKCVQQRYLYSDFLWFSSPVRPFFIMLSFHMCC